MSRLSIHTKLAIEALTGCLALSWQKYEEGKEVVKAMAALREAGAVPKWGIKENELQRRNVFLRQLNEVWA